MSKENTGDRKGEFKIDQMFSEIYETETMNLQDGSELLAEGLSKEEKERILKMALEKMNVEQKSVDTIPKRNKRRILTIALVAVLAFATTAFAAELFQWDVRISNYLGIKEENRGSLSGGGMNVGVSAEDNGVKIEAVQTIGDANNMYILLDVTAPEGQRIYPNTRFDMVYLTVDGVTGMGYSCDMLPDKDENDNKATLLVSMDANNKINDKTIKLKFENMGHYVIGDGDMKSDVKGVWELEWKLNYKDISTTYQIGREMEREGNKVTGDSIAVSPIALNLRMSGDYFKELDSKPPQPGWELPLQINAVTLKDGTVLTQDDVSSTGTSNRGTEFVMNMQFKELLDAKQVKSVTVNDTVIELE